MENVIVLNGDGTDINLLKEENIDDMDAVVTATGFDEDNLLLALTAKNRGVEDVIAKISREIYTDMVAQLGVDMALNPLAHLSHLDISCLPAHFWIGSFPSRVLSQT